MLQICFSVFCVILTVTFGYNNINKSVSLYRVRAITEKERIKNMDNVVGKSLFLLYRQGQIYVEFYHNHFDYYSTI